VKILTYTNIILQSPKLMKLYPLLFGKRSDVFPMRNHLAEEVLNSEMLHLMELYKESLGQAGLKLSATIELLRCTSVLIKNFRDKRPITNISDDRIQQNHGLGIMEACEDFNLYKHNSSKPKTDETISSLVW
jgi:hypothetical protein